MHLNGSEIRKDASFDIAFVKALVIGICHVKSIEQNGNIHKDMYIFLKGCAV